MNKIEARQILAHYMDVFSKEDELVGVQRTQLKEALGMAIGCLDAAYNYDTYLPGSYKEKPKNETT